MTTVKYTPNPHQKPQLTKEQEDKLMALCDQDIDYSDIPELDNDFWQKAGQRQPSKTPSGGSITNHS
ncbi:hypothetical protein [Crocosphaera sp. XPORK-15E]|uniref:hypothetical protein n=1 Tax=Crocosphaera sp. XPORK-15E TaxID=3110247 RepID=UPI002B21F26E|nr:hypothetical protein [Crocosphaera sp. XPORK-15E]MEA5537094.1 hypothetical protein [Crocosphaera sp. XPORK-15E]